MKTYTLSLLIAWQAITGPQIPVYFDRATLGIEVVAATGDVILTVTSPWPWRLETCGRLKEPSETDWTLIRSGTPDPNGVDIVRVADEGWARIAFRSFYRLRVLRDGDWK